ncbi:hypothetical protein MGALJ_19100 [Mycobacterium gallinarum]|uniref:Uncharacterized protein n=1 Tax=Mycobacterium gallinarum TaxID=39689 RepID=A0A9W4B1H8_9MYCO|nr:hypothetical protein MGALJ_19100 [Mycobacterium gallinarum]
MSDRKNGETLARSDSVAMMPTVQPAAAGTHLNAEVRRAFAMFAEPAGLVTVIRREDIRSTGQIGVSSYQTGPVYFSPGP